jgi:hypothetical protein
MIIFIRLRIKLMIKVEFSKKLLKKI